MPDYKQIERNKLARERGWLVAPSPTRTRADVATPDHHRTRPGRHDGALAQARRRFRPLRVGGVGVPVNRADPVSVHEAVRIAQRIFGTPEQPEGVAANDEAYVIGFNTAFNTATITSSWVYIYKQTGECRTIGSGLMGQMAATLDPVDYP